MNIPNIGPQGRRNRFVMGLTVWLLGLAAAIGMSAAGVDRSWRWLLLVPFWLGALGVFQAAVKT